MAGVTMMDSSGEPHEDVDDFEPYRSI
jgi:hypothetical protein